MPEVFKRMMDCPHELHLDTMKSAKLLYRGYLRGWNNMSRWQRLNVSHRRPLLGATPTHAHLRS